MATQVIRGNGSPEGFIEAGKGTFYINTQSYSVFVKIKGEGNTNKGWRAMNIKGFYENDGNPEGVVEGPLNAICYDSTNDTLYIQTKTDVNIMNTGWVSLNKGDIIISLGNPNTDKVIGEKGDLYIDNESISLYLYTEDSWEKISLIVVDSTDVLLKVSELLTNTTAITHQYFNMFFNPSPMDIELSQYDEDGILKTYKIPNRAKDTVTLVGEGNPEGVVTAIKGQLYLDTETGTPYIKNTDMDDAYGWSSLKLPTFLAPIYYDSQADTLSITLDDYPVEGSPNMLNSHTLLQEFNKVKNGNPNELFSVAEPIMGEHATTKNYVDELHSNMFGYDKNTRTLYINAPLNTDVTESITLMEGSENPISGSMFTPMFGSGYSTVLTFTNLLVESENTEISVYSELPCTIRFTSNSGKTFDVELTYEKLYERCFNEDMQEGIKTMQIISTPYYRVATVENIKELYRGIGFNIVEIIEG